MLFINAKLATARLLSLKNSVIEIVPPYIPYRIFKMCPSTGKACTYYLALSCVYFVPKQPRILKNKNANLHTKLW